MVDLEALLYRHEEVIRDALAGIQIGAIIVIFCLLSFGAGWQLAVEAIVEANGGLTLMDVSIKGVPAWVEAAVRAALAILIVSAVTDVIWSVSIGEIEIPDLSTEGDHD